MCQRALESLLGSLLAAWLMLCVGTGWHEAVSFLGIWHPDRHGVGITRAIELASQGAWSCPVGVVLASQCVWSLHPKRVLSWHP